jgi:hypothetical protein
MPDAQGNYLGDHATVLPDNTQAFLHFSNKFSEIEGRRQAEQQAKLKAEQERQDKLLKTVGDSFKFEPSADPTNDEFVNLTTKGMQTALEIGKEKGPEAMQTFITKYVGSLGGYRQKIKEFGEHLPKQIATASKNLKGIDESYLLELMKDDYFFTTGQDGKKRRKTIEEVINNPELDVTKYIAEHGDLVWREPNAGAEDFYKSLKLEDVGDERKYDEKGNSVREGYTGKVPGELVQVKYKDDKGKPYTETRHEIYKFPDGTPLVDQATKQPVKILPKDIYERMMSRIDIAGPIEAKVKAHLEKEANNFNGQGMQMHGPQSEYAEMLRQKFAFEAADQFNKFELKPDDDKSFERKNTLLNQKRQAEILKVMKQNANTSLKNFQLREQMYKDKKAKGENPEEEDVDFDFPDVLDVEYGEDVELEDGTTVRMK